MTAAGRGFGAVVTIGGAYRIGDIHVRPEGDGRYSYSVPRGGVVLSGEVEYDGDSRDWLAILAKVTAAAVDLGERLRAWRNGCPAHDRRRCPMCEAEIVYGGRR
ncbi:hypothetical protein SEA_CHRIS_81 [Mycobacterium phage Chris]|uniref:Uncharacterized protein n=1 Tax=Mycobacterium phage Chris TaxID=2725626 RepID=A0A6M3SWW1_9CAUD|nr:hypothetical protein I5G96_gp024 [Mycobacterium phage Chris]QJD50483.1 hypothetical protein SEA_CHRIS_81 [Mycobacterium phage Chris]